jgi:hypothetical protein
MNFNGLIADTLVFIFSSSVSIAGAPDPNCDTGNAAKSAAMRATFGFGGRCTPAKAAKDMTRDAVGIDDNGFLKNNKKDHGFAKKATKKALD